MEGGRPEVSDLHFTAIFTDRCLILIRKVYGDVADCKQVVALCACVLIAIAIVLADKRRCAQVLFHRLMGGGGGGGGVDRFVSVLHHASCSAGAREPLCRAVRVLKIVSGQTNDGLAGTSPPLPQPLCPPIHHVYILH